MQEITAKLYGPGDEDYTGTAWLCSQEYALTAAHCVGDRINKVLKSGEFTLSFLNFELKAVVKTWDPDLDVALLSIKGGEIPERVQVTLKPLPPIKPWPVGTDAVRWQSCGYPRGKAGAMTLWGYIDASESYVTDDAKDRDPKRRQPAIQLTCEQGGYDNLGGISGSAVSNDNVIVGLVRCGPPSFEQRVIYASPLNRIAEAFPEVRAILNANLKQEIYAVTPSAARGTPAAPRAPELFGREHDIAEVGELLKGGARLVTFVGERGVGKTVLAQAVGRGLSDDYSDGVYLVDLSLVTDAGQVAAEIAHTLGVKESPDGSLEESVGAYLSDKQALIILDGFEGLDGARPLVEGLIDKPGRLQFIVTCRAALGWAGERAYAVGTLSLDAAAGEPPESAPAVALFVKRAERANPAYTCAPATRGEIRAICETLGGLPLAIELAAALGATPDFSPALVLERLKAAGGAGGGRLAALVELCYESLEEGAQECLRRLTIFSGPVTPEAAEAVAASAGAYSQADARKELSGLSRRGLLHEQRLGGGEFCYRVPRPVLDYCERKLKEADEATSARETASARRAHAVYYAQFTRKAERRLNLLTSAERRDWLKRLEAEHEEIRAALKWSLSGEGNAELGLEIVGNMFWFWNLRAYLTEGRRWADEVLAAARPALAKENKETEALGKALYCAGGLAFMHGDYAAARATLEENVGVWERLPNHRRLGYTLIVLGMVALNQDQTAEARGHEERCVKLFREIDDRWGLALALNDLANVCLEEGREEEARSNYQQSLAVWRELGDEWGYGLTTSNLGNLYYREGDLLMAKQHLAEASALQRDEDNQWGWAESIKRLGHITFDEGDYAQAARLFYDSMGLHQKIGRKQLLADCFDGLARVAAEVGRPAHSARLFGAATTIRRQIGAQMSQPQTALRKTNIEAAVTAATRKGVTREEFQAHWDEGEAWTLDVAVKEAKSYAAEWRT